MQITTLEGVIDRRILVNYRVDPDYLQRLLPSPFRPKRIHGMGIAGICLIRLKQLRPRALPALLGFSSENAAHRIAVEWEENGVWREGVYIPRRDTASQFNRVVGGTLFPSVLHHAHFQVTEQDGAFSIQVASDDGQTQIAVEAQVAQRLAADSIFASLDEASAFFEQGSLSFSATKKANELDSVEIRCATWRVEPLQVVKVYSNYFDDAQRFPAGSAALDCALVMRAIPHEWHVHDPMRTPDRQAERATDGANAAKETAAVARSF